MAGWLAGWLAGGLAACCGSAHLVGSIRPSYACYASVPSQGLKIAENSSLGVSENTSEWRLGPESLVIQEKSWKHETIPHADPGLFLDK